MPAISVKRFAHCNVNCSSLERSRRFYEDVVGLRAAVHTCPPVQEAGGFPMPSGEGGRVQWDAWMMHDHRGPAASPALDLLEWKVPRPIGAPYASANHLGYYRLCYLVPEVDELYQRFLDSGAVALSAPTTVWLDAEHTHSVRVFCGFDPDRTCLEFVEHSHARAPQVIHVNVNCSDLQESSAWYTGNLGLEVSGSSAPGAQPGSTFGFEGECEWEASFLSLPGQSGVFTVDLLEWKQPVPVGRPYETANQLGIYRMAFIVDDIQECHATLTANGVACTGPPVKLDMGPGVPVDGLWALFFTDPDGTCLELIEEPTARA